MRVVREIRRSGDNYEGVYSRVLIDPAVMYIHNLITTVKVLALLSTSLGRTLES